MNERFQEKLLEELQKRFPVIPSERDTHFANAAKLLVDKMMATNTMDTLDADRFLDNDDFAELQTLFAQFLYDFAMHTAESLDPLTHGTDSAYVAWLASRVASIPDIPDFTPQTPESSPAPGP